MKIDPTIDPRTFWNDLYENKSAKSTGKPSAVLEKFVMNRASGDALELGCGRGDDAVWLAKKGWQVTAIDISETALVSACGNAKRNNVAGNITFAARDLMTDFPGGNYDLVTAQFLESPVIFARNSVLNIAARRVRTGGMLLITSHGSGPSWSFAPKDTVYPTPEEALANLNLDLDHWDRVFVDNLERDAKGPNGEEGRVIDTVIALERTTSG